MSNNAHDKTAQEAHFADVFARLKEQDIEQFYAHYQLWMLRRRIPLLEKQVETLREHLAENLHTLEALRPSALAQAVLVRLQSNGVSDTDVLDLMLDRGEDWLDRMMQRLDYCEQVQDFIQGNYTQWCIRSLEGAYDWIDSLLGSIKENNGHEESSASDSLATEELLLQRLSQDDEEAIPQQPSLQPELSITGMPETGVENQPYAEVELTRLSDQARTETEPEPLLFSGEVAEQPESSEEEPQPELFGWKDLEDLEAPEGHPAPWYSIDLTENGTSSTSIDAGRANSANDWISVLQADNKARLEASEHVTFAGTEEMLPTSNQEGAVEIKPSASIPQTASAETVISESEPTLIFTAEATVDAESVDEAHAIVSETETLDEVETIFVTNNQLMQEQVSSPGEILHDSASAYPHEMESEAALTIEFSTDEATAAQLENLDDALTGIANALDTVARNILSDKEEKSQAEIMQNQVEPELQLGMGEKGGASIEEVAAIIDDGEESKEKHGGIEEATLAVYELVENEDLKVTVEKVDKQSENSALHVPEGEVDEPSESVPLEDTTRYIEELAESAVSEIPEQYNDTLQVDESQSEETGEVQSQEIESNTTGEGNEIESAAVLNDILSIEGEQEEQMAWYEYLELDEPADGVNGVNGVTHAEGIEQSDLSKLANDTPQRVVDEQSTLNGVGSTEPEVDLLAGEANVPEIYEHTAAEENTHEERESGLKESVIAERPGEIEGWQTWQTQEKDDETLPLALKDIQSAQQLQEDTTREAADAESGEEPGLALEKDVEGEISDTAEEEVRLDELASANTVEMSVVFEGEAGEHAGEASGTPTLPVDELSMIDTVEQIAVTATEISPTITIPASEKHEPKETPITQIGTGKAFAPTTAAMSEESTLLLDYQHISSHGENREETPTGRIAERPQIETLAGPPREIAPAPKKPGFWRRLFRFGRKKR